MPRIKVCFTADRMGGVTATPEADKWRTKFAKHMAEMGQPRYASVYFQAGADELIGSIPHRKLRELAEGGGVVCRVDAWEFGHWLGYDAHTVAE